MLVSEETSYLIAKAIGVLIQTIDQYRSGKDFILRLINDKYYDMIVDK